MRRANNGLCVFLKQGNVTKQRHDVGYQRRDVPETTENPRRDVDIACRDVLERFKINVATLGTHVATFQRV